MLKDSLDNLENPWAKNLLTRMGVLPLTFLSLSITFCLILDSKEVEPWHYVLAASCLGGPEKSLAEVRMWDWGRLWQSLLVYLALVVGEP